MVGRHWKALTDELRATLNRLEKASGAGDTSEGLPAALESFQKLHKVWHVSCSLPTLGHQPPRQRQTRPDDSLDDASSSDLGAP